jgi:histidine triad (HIT) family protein
VVAVREVYRDECVVAFFPSEPATLGHTLVVPRRHIPDIWSLDEETAERLAWATMRVSSGVRRAFQPEGLNIIQSNGDAATQTVFHLHIHVLPRWSNDLIGDIWPPPTNYSEGAKDDAWRRMRLELQEDGDVTEDPDAMTTDMPVSPDDRRKHLDFIQAVVTRMSSASSTAKGWLLPVVTVAYGYALTRHASSVALLGVAASLLFSLLDANYLRQEKAYRRLYDAVVRSTREVPIFSLDPSHAEDLVPPAVTFREKLAKRLNRWIPDFHVWMSWSIAPFYGGLVAVGIIIFMATT